jgi:hypothetical protein
MVKPASRGLPTADALPAAMLRLLGLLLLLLLLLQLPTGSKAKRVNECGFWKRRVDMALKLTAKIFIVFYQLYSTYIFFNNFELIYIIF